MRDPQSYARQFPDALASMDAFEDTMTWLDAACYAATDPQDVEKACLRYPEWRLRCVQYDGSDAALLGLAELIRAVERTSPLPEPIARDCLLEILQQILKNEPELVGAQVESAFHEGGDVATLELGLGRPVLVTLLRNVASTAAVCQGLLAHYRMTEPEKSWAHCLLVLPDLEIDQPMFLTSRVSITNMDPDHVRTALVRIARR